MEKESIKLVIQEKEAVVEKAENLIDEHYGPIQSIVNDTPEIVESEKVLWINSAQKHKAAVDCLGLVKGHLKTIEDRRKICLDPFKNATKVINDHAKKITVDLQKVANSVNGKLVMYDNFLQAEKEKKDAEAMKKMEEAAAKNEPLPIPEEAPVAVPEQVKTDNTTNTMVDHWKCEVINEKDLIDHAVKTGQYELVQVNQPNLNKLVKMIKNSRLIPGVKIYNQKSSMTRSK